MTAIAPKLSEQLRDAIDGGEECRGRDSQLTEWIELAEGLEAKVAALEKQVRLAAGMLSTTGSFADKHPEVALRFIQDAQAKDDASDQHRQFTDGRGNDLTHLVG